MTAPQPETPVTAIEERIGNYRVHPVAAMFPLLEGNEYEEFRETMKLWGQQKPIIVQGDLLLDGRNRLRACLDLGIKPRVEQYNGPPDVVPYIAIANFARRDLTDQQRGAIAAKIELWRIINDNAEEQDEARRAQGHHGAEGGRGHKKPSDLKSDPRVSGRDLATKNARSTVGRIAESAKISRHQAAQTVAVAKAAPDLLEQVAKGTAKLKDAHAKVKSAKTAQPPARKPGYLDVKTRLIHRIRHAMRTYPSSQADLRKSIIEAMDQKG
jgi:hypothetical protein